MLTLGVWILVAWFVGIPLALWALYGVLVVLGNILEGLSEFVRAVCLPFTAAGRAEMREAAKAERARVEALKAHKSSPTEIKVAWVIGGAPWAFLALAFVWVTVGGALGLYHPS